MWHLTRRRIHTKMETLLSDTETYKLLTCNPVNKMLTQSYLKMLLKEWEQCGFIENSIYNKSASNLVVRLLHIVF